MIVKEFCTFLREHGTNVNNFEKKKMLPLTKKELKLQNVTFVEKDSLKSLLMMKIIEK